MKLYNEPAKEIDVATMISKLPPDLITKLLMANHRAELEGDHRSLLNPKKLLPLLKQVDRDYYNNLKKGAMSDMLPDSNAEKLADNILNLVGLHGTSGLIRQLKALYPDMNKAFLVDLGAENLSKMLAAFDKYVSNNSIEENQGKSPRENIDVFQTFLRQIAIGKEPDMFMKYDLDIAEEECFQKPKI